MVFVFICRMDFVYASRGESINYSQWDAENGQPNKDNKRANCVQVQNHSGDWGDIDCRAKRNYVCEIPSNVPQLFWDGSDGLPINLKAEAVKRYIMDKFLSSFQQPNKQPTSSSESNNKITNSKMLQFHYFCTIHTTKHHTCSPLIICLLLGQIIQ